MAVATPEHDPAKGLSTLLAVHALGIIVPVLVVLALLVPPAVAVVVAVVLGVLVTAVRTRGIDGRVTSALGAQLVDPGTQPRLANLAESMAMAVGTPVPKIHLIESPARNGLAWGISGGEPLVALTTGLVEVADLVEIEAVVAHLLTDVRDGFTVVPTAATGLFGSLAPRLGNLARGSWTVERVIESDLESARLTRFPPGSVAALERIASGTTSLSSPPAMRALWLVDPIDDGSAADVPGLDVRIDALREL